MAFVRMKTAKQKTVGMETVAVSYAKAQTAIPAAVFEAPELISLSEQGHPVSVAWVAVPGCTAAAVASASIKLAGAAVERPVDAAVSQDGEHRILDFGAPVFVTKLVLADLSVTDGSGSQTPLQKTSDLQSAGMRLVVSFADTAGNFSPLYTAPPSPARGMLPPPVGTAEFSSGTLSFAGVKTDRIRLSLVQNDFPEDYAAQAFQVGVITAYGEFGPTDCRVVDESENVLWSFPGELTSFVPPAVIDLKIPLETGLNGKIKAGEATEVTFRITGGASGKGYLWNAGVQGELVRSVKGITTVDIAGEARPLPCFQTLPAEAPIRVAGDLTIRYNAVRLCPGLNDSLPGAGAVSGAIVEASDVVRPLPAAQIGELAVARVGLIGRSPQPCELAIRLVALTNGVPTQTIGSETVVVIEPSDRFRVHWCDLTRVEIAGAMIGLSVRAVSGRFFWVKGAEDCLVKIAVYDEEPSMCPVTLDQAALVQAGAEPIHLPGFSFPTSPFTVDAPVLDSLLFVTVDISDLELRYAR